MYSAEVEQVIFVGTYTGGRISLVTFLAEQEREYDAQR